LQDQPRSEHVDRLRALVSGQILSCAWREGMSAEEVKPYAEEALSFARASDKMHEPILIGAYGRVLASTAATDDYVNLVLDAVKLTSGEGDVGRFATVNAMLSQAYFMSGRLNEALDAGDVALAAISEQGGFDKNVTLGLNPNQIMGFDVEHWVKCLKVRILVRLGRFGEAEQRLQGVLQAVPERVAAVVQFIPHFASVEMAWGLGKPELAQPHAAKVAELADLSGMPYLRVAAMVCAALANATAGEFNEAASEFREAIAFARRASAGLEFEGRMLADLADVLYRAGDFNVALEACDEAIAVSRRRTDRLAELHATVVRGLTLAAADDARGAEEVRQLIFRADELLNVSGAAFFSPRLEKLRLQLEPLE
jgi:tetratricopeptide (TPR) repeat protein